MEKCSSSMQVTRAADYGVRVMIYLAGLPDDERISLPALAEASGAPQSFLSKVLQALTRADLIASRRGQSGGFVLSERGRNASVREIVEAVDGPIHLNVCAVGGASCARKPWCAAHPVWMKAQDAMLKVLSSARVSDLAAEDTQHQTHSATPVLVQARAARR